MATYIGLYRWTAKGLDKIKESPDRLERAKRLAAEVGGSLKSFYMTIGEYDLVAVWEMPDDEAYAHFALRLLSLGSVTGHTLKAFSEQEYRKLIGSL